MTIRKKAIRDLKDTIIDLKKKLNNEKLDKRYLLWAHENEDNSLQYQFHKYNKNKHYADRNG